VKNEKLLSSIGNIADKYITEAQATEVRPPKSKVVTLFRKPAVIAAAIAAFLLLSAFTAYVVTGGDLWIQKPSNDPKETVRSAIENQVGKDYTISVEVESIEIDGTETVRVVESFISGVIAERRGWSDEYLAEHFIVVKAVYYAEYDHTQTTRSDGNVVQYFYLTRDIDSGEWTIVDNSGNVNWSDNLTAGNEAHTGVSDEVRSIKEQMLSYLSELFTEAYTPYYDGLHYEMTNYDETIVDGACTATFFWTMYHLGKGWDVAGDEGAEMQGNFSLQATVTINDNGELDLSTISILADNSASGPPDYCLPIEDFFPDQLAD
jgi:hypothetical protein